MMANIQKPSYCVNISLSEILDLDSLIAQPNSV